MIKASAMSGGRPLLLLGLSAENVRRLQAGQPIRLHTDPLGLPAMDVVICAGETEESIAAAMRHAGLIDERTVVHGLET